MKRLIFSTTDANAQINNNADLVEFLNSKGIDTTKKQYKLSYKFYDRFDTENNSIKFTCPGDYLALFSTRLAGIHPQHSIPNYNNINDEIRIDEVIDIVDENPTFQDLYSYGEDSEWFSREEFGHIELVDLTTNTVLVEDQDEGGWDEYEEEWED